jgi:8-oxo-dGTP diphosphatase
MEKEIEETYGLRVRVRVCGLCWNQDKLLMVRHKSLQKDGFWSPPGGGIDFGQSIHDTLKQEFLEETDLSVHPGAFRFGCEFIQNPLHAIELFYQIDNYTGIAKSGYDPEIQLIEEVRFMSFEEIRSIPKANIHGIFHTYPTKTEIEQLSGFYRI